MGGTGEPAQSNEAEMSRTKRSRDDYEADDENDTPMVKRVKVRRLLSLVLYILMSLVRIYVQDSCPPPFRLQNIL